jgi:hypothetical protein
MAGCGAGVSNGEFSIIGKYKFSDSGGDGKMVIRRDSWWRMGQIVVSPKVVSYAVHGKDIIVARRPLRSVWHKGIITGVEVLPTCEFWLIDTVVETTMRVNNGGRWPDVSCEPTAPLTESVASRGR